MLSNSPNKANSSLPLVSVIIPVYNMENFVAETLESVLASDYRNIEVIVMDDGSTDSSQTVAESFCGKDNRIRVFSQTNSGASAARNNAIKLAKGKYILPVDSDNRISTNYIGEAVNIFETRSDVRVVSCEAEYFGEKHGRWRIQPFSINLLCRRNLIDNCAMYRHSDWEAAGGYCNRILGREDWDFWLSLFEMGGNFVRLPFVGLYYRSRSDSKRVRTRHLHKQIIDYLNARHKPLFFEQLKGKLHYQRTYSRLINRIVSVIRPHNVETNSKNMCLRKAVYIANDKLREDLLKLLSISDDVQKRIRYIDYSEYRFHIPFSKINTSKARLSYDKNNVSHIGYYEEQISFVTLKSYLVVLDGE